MSVRAKAIGSAAAADLQRFALSLWPIRERCRAALVCFGVVLKFVRSLGAGDKCTLASTLWLRVITLARTGSLRATVDTCVGMTAGRLHASSAAAQVLDVQHVKSVNFASNNFCVTVRQKSRHWVHVMPRWFGTALSPGRVVKIASFMISGVCL